MNGSFDWQLIFDWLPEMYRGSVATIYISFFSLILALSIGLFISLMRLSHIRLIRVVAIAYVDLIRGTPALLQIMAIYFGLPFFGIRIPAILAGILALGINSGAYIAEMIRGALESIDKGQMEAARGLGMSYSAAMRRVVIPQIFQVIIPPITGEYNSLVKGSSLLSVISIAELTRVGQRMLGVSFKPVESLLPIAILYFIINWFITRSTNKLESKLAQRGYSRT